MKFEYSPKGVCSQKFEFDIDENTNKIKSLKVLGGCNGNLQGISSLLVGMDINDVANKLKGIKCGFKNTSCPDQIAEALKSYLENNK